MSAMIWVLLVVAGFWAFGPWALAIGLLALVLTRRPRRTVVMAGLASILLPIALIVVPMAAPQGALPMLDQPGILATAGSFTDEGWRAQAVEAEAAPSNPFMADNPANSMHNDPWASDAYAFAGPVRDEQSRTDSAAYGVLECATVTVDSHGALVAQCGNLRGSRLQVLDPQTLRPLSSLQVSKRQKSDKPPWADLCGGAYFYLDNEDRAVAVTSDRSIVRVATRDSEGRASLSVVDDWQLSDVVPRGDCLVALMPDWNGLIWWATSGGLVGTLDPESEQVETLDLGAEIANSLAGDADGSIYVVTTDKLYRLHAPHGQPVEVWSVPYDSGTRLKPGLLSQGSGTTPTLLDDGMIAIADNAEPRMNVMFLDRESGEEQCRVPVFENGASATENSLISLGDAVLVENNYGYAGPQSTMLGRAPVGGLARVDLSSCSVAWTSTEIAPTSVPKVAWGNGLVYAVTTRRTWSGVSAFYLTALDVSTGRTAFRWRLGVGWPSNNHYSAITLTADGSAYVATMGGMYRVH